MEAVRLSLSRTGTFKKDQKRIRKRGYNEAKLSQIVVTLLTGAPLAERFKNHKLKGDYMGHWECHIEPDWLLIYRYEGMNLQLVRTGTHADLFDK